MDSRQNNKPERWVKIVHVLTFVVVSIIVIALFVFYKSTSTVLNHSENVMDKADVFFGVMWKTLCNGTMRLLTPQECQEIKSIS